MDSMCCLDVPTLNTFSRPILTVTTVWNTGETGNIYIIKFVHTSFPHIGFELRSWGPQAGVLPIEPPLLVIAQF